MRKLILLGLVLSLLLSGCASVPSRNDANNGLTKYNATFLTLFDTVTTIVGFAENEDAFRADAQAIHDELLQYHRLFDIYNDYEGIHNLKTVNDSAGIAPVQVDPRIIDLLTDCVSYYELTGGKVNVAMGSVLYLWHEARNDGINDPANARLPEWEDLTAAGEHTAIESLVIDKEVSTVFLSDPSARLDVGAIAKGWSLQRVCEGYKSGLLISLGGNVMATGPKDETGTPWVVGVQDPDQGDNYLHTIYVSSGSVVTSGDYQRTYMVDGKLYHHIIDPETLYPSDYWRSVTIVHPDSGLADALSTALFLLPREEGQKLLDTCGAEAMWVDAGGNLYYSPGFEDLIRT